ncbi:hypothetical protein J6500_10270 [Bradyrhizobium sp. WSM 1704]|uniref:hypothetical protein n=1 Tax=Bradyrhizobium semiaridum TaxID=2821404 RepID=UPI001CE3A6F7|nr:hypothetical protein [Bradyrhizobium semiaridum]MCA6122269.1 hypothetical protein [Bradyrhizobium semiaridum]
MVQKQFSMFLSRLRRIVNVSVARMLAARERQVSRFMLRRFGGRPLTSADIRRSRLIARRTLFALVVAGLSAPVFTRAEELIVRGHHGARAQHVASQQPDRHRCRYRSQWNIVVASAIPAILDQRTE